MFSEKETKELYRKLRQEIVEELLGYGISFSFTEEGDTDSEKILVIGRTLSTHYVERMVELATEQLENHYRWAELGKSVERLTKTLADKNIEIKVVDK